MYPELIHLDLPVVGEFTIYSFGAMMALAFLAGYVVLRAECRRRMELEEDLAADILLGALIGGIVGAKLYYVLFHWERTVLDPLGMLLARGGLVWYGGLIGGAIGGVLAVRRRGADLAAAADATAPALALAYAIGRVGCFLVGDDYGRPTESWVGIAFPNGIPPTTAGNLREYGADVPASVPDTEVLAVHPTQLYETGVSLLIFLLLWRFRTRPRAAGWLFGLWLVLAGLERLVVEFFRAKDDRLLGTFTLSQAFAVAAVLLGAWVLGRRRGAPAGEGAAAEPARADA